MLKTLSNSLNAIFKPEQQTSSSDLGAKPIWVRKLKDIFLIATGILSASFGFKGFLLTNHFIDGGATGISL